MGCFTADWLVQLLVWAIVISVVYAIVMLLLPKIQLGEPFTTVVQIVKIVLWGVVAIMIVYFLADLIYCALGNGPLLPRAHLR